MRIQLFNVEVADAKKNYSHLITEFVDAVKIPEFMDSANLIKATLERPVIRPEPEEDEVAPNQAEDPNA